MNKNVLYGLIIPQLIKQIITMFWYPDPSLVLVERTNIVPYSVLWQLLNYPVKYLTLLTDKTISPYPIVDYSGWQMYALWLLVIDSIFAGLYLYLWTKGRIGAILLIFYHATIIWGFLHGYSNVSVIWFAPLATLFFPLAFLTLIQKLPLGWSLTLNDNHVQCALTCAARFDLWHGYYYTIILIWTVVPLYLGLKNFRSRTILAR